MVRHSQRAQLRNRSGEQMNPDHDTMLNRDAVAAALTAAGFPSALQHWRPKPREAAGLRTDFLVGGLSTNGDRYWNGRAVANRPLSRTSAAHVAKERDAEIGKVA